MNSDTKPIKKAPIYVITCGDEGVQINEGVRLSVVGAGVKLEGFAEVVKALKSLLGENLLVAASQENDWIKQQFNLTDWDETNATAQQQTEALADDLDLVYVGYLPFRDPKKLKFDIKGHMVRPHDVHVANKICFTLGGGEQTYNLGCYQISAEWLHKVNKKIAKQILDTQINFYNKIAGSKLELICELRGELGEKAALKNKKALEKLGYKLKD